MGPEMAQRDKLRESAKKYMSQGLDLIALNGKRPIDKEWTDTMRVQYTPDGVNHAIVEGHNIGHRLGPREIIIDVDPRNGGIKSWNNLGNKIPDLLWLQETVLTPSGGFHVYCTLPESHQLSTPLPKNLNEYPGIDFLRRGNQVVIPGSMGAEGKAYRWAPQAQLTGQELPKAAYELLLEGNPKIGSLSHLDSEARERFYRQNGWNLLTAQELNDLLALLAPENYRDYVRWFTLMAACHFATGGEGEDAFVRWSTMDPDYAEDKHKIAKHWSSLSKEGSSLGGTPITTLSLVHEFKQIGLAEKTHFLQSRLGSRLREAATFEAVTVDVETLTGAKEKPADTQSAADRLNHWLDKLKKIKSDADVVGPFLREMAESPDLLPAQRELIFQAIKERTGLGLATLREDFKIHSKGLEAFLNNQSEERQQITQAEVTVATIAKLGGRGLIMMCQNDFYRWKGNGRWETEHPELINQAIMNVMEEVGFVPITSGTISSIHKMIKTQIFREDDIWDSSELDKFSAQKAPMINMTDGELHLNVETKQWELRRHKPESYRRSILPLRYEVGLATGCPRWEQFIEETLWCEDEDELDTRKRQVAVFMAYSMIESMPWLKKSIYLYGPPDTGKSVLLDLVQSMIGQESVADLSLSQLGGRFGPSNLVNKLANITGEIARGELIADGPFKSLISGDTIMVERKGQDGFSFSNKAVFWFAGNNLPRSRDKSGAIESRMLYIPFDWPISVGRREVNLRDTLIQEQDAIAIWALQIFLEEWQKDYCIGICNKATSGMKKVMDEWKDETDPARLWVKERVNIMNSDAESLVESDANTIDFHGMVDFTSSEALYADYTKWCSGNGYMPLTNKHLGRSISNMVQEIAGALRTRDRAQFLSAVKHGKSYVDMGDGGRKVQVRGWHGLSLVPRIYS